MRRDDCAGDIGSLAAASRPSRIHVSSTMTEFGKSMNDSRSGVLRLCALLNALADTLCEMAEAACDEREFSADAEVVALLRTAQEGRSGRTPGRLTPVEELDDHRAKRWRRPGAFEAFEACQDRLTRPQWRVVCLFFRDGKSQSETAALLGTSRSAVSGLLTRAKQRKDRYYRQLRAEQTHLLRKHLNS